MASSVMGMLRSDVRLATPHLQTGRSHPDTGPAACRSTVPRERFTPVARTGSIGPVWRGPFLGEDRKRAGRRSNRRLWPRTDIWAVARCIFWL